MITLIVALTILMSILVGWSIGANDAANSMGVAVGSRVLSLRQAIVLVVVFGLLGALVQGGEVTKTIGNGIVKMSALEGETRSWVALTASLSACLWVIIATYLKMPISTSHSIVGAVAGAGLAVNASINWCCIRDIFICWILTPAGAALLGYVLYRLLQVVFDRFVPAAWGNRMLTVLIIISGCYVAYTWGANDVANATGVLVGAGLLSCKASVIMGGLAIALGIVTWGYKVIETIGFQITQLLPLMAFAAQLASAINVHVYTVVGIPVSTSHSIVGAICGVGLVRGLHFLNLRIMREILVCWVATPLISGVLSFGLLKLLIMAVQV